MEIGASNNFFSRLKIDWIMLSSALVISFLGIITMSSFTSEDAYVNHQVIWLILSLLVFFILSIFDYRFLNKTKVVVAFFLTSIFLLVAVFLLGHTAKGAQSWFTIGGISFQPSDPVKLGLIILLSKYFSRRHVEIRNFRHILVSGFYSLIIFLLILIEPDFGSALVIFFIWLGMIFVSGVSKKHLLMVFLTGAIVFSGLWVYVLKDYQKNRVLNFIHPLADTRGTGYNANQALIALGSGQVLGKGIGYGTQSKLKFLPEYKTDFIFSAYAEELKFYLVSALQYFLWRIFL